MADLFPIQLVVDFRRTVDEVSTQAEVVSSREVLQTVHRKLNSIMDIWGSVVTSHASEIPRTATMHFKSHKALIHGIGDPHALADALYDVRLKDTLLKNLIWSLTSSHNPEKKPSWCHSEEKAPKHWWEVRLEI
jgi:hypothetical protein